ncbi:MAG: hypothetical protein R2771_02480 [Saprospiraceae bacterium]
MKRNFLSDNTMGGVITDNQKQIAFWGLPNNFLVQATNLYYEQDYPIEHLIKLITGIINGIDTKYVSNFSEED